MRHLILFGSEYSTFEELFSPSYISVTTTQTDIMKVKVTIIDRICDEKMANICYISYDSR